MSDYIPGRDGEFDQWQKNLLTYAGANTAALGIVAADLAACTSAQTAWTSAYADHLGKQTAAQAARELKDMKREALEQALRQLVRKLQASSAVDDSERQALGITVKDSTLTMATATAVAATRPVGVVDTSRRLRHEIKFYDESTPTSRARPKGVMGCEILVKIAGNGEAAPKDASECQLLALDTASSYLAEYSGEHAGKTAYYMLRWVNTRGEKGPLSETVAATIVG